MGSIGERLREERTRLDLSQEALGVIGGVRKQAQLKYEKGETTPNATYLAALARVGADVQYIVTGQRNSAALSADEEELVARFRAASLAVKAAAMGALQGAAEAMKPAKHLHVSAPGGYAAGRDVVINGEFSMPRRTDGEPKQ